MQRDCNTNEILARSGSVALLLAAGRGSRYHGPTHKLLAPFRGRPLYEWALDAALAAVGEVWLVWGGAGDPPETLRQTAGVTVLINDRWSFGQATSLSLGIAHALALAADDRPQHLIVGLADQPLIPAEAWRRVDAERSSPIAVATYDGRRRNPVRLSQDVWTLIPSAGDEGARSLLNDRPELVTLVPCPGNPADIDTTEDLVQWNSPTNS
jgi:molybdenum cofactor cytidylyltransferase